jgi:hypothetical protein
MPRVPLLSPSCDRTCPKAPANLLLDNIYHYRLKDCPRPADGLIDEAARQPLARSHFRKTTLEEPSGRRMEGRVNRVDLDLIQQRSLVPEPAWAAVRQPSRLSLKSKAG